MDERKLRRKNTLKIVRSVFELIVIIAVILWAVLSLVRQRSTESLLREESEAECVMVPSSEIVGDWPSTGKADGPHFIAVSYNGLTDIDRPDGKIVTQDAYEEQLQTLKASGYQTITQQDVLNYYLNDAPLPEKAMLLIFEDGIMNTTKLAHPALWKNNYIATVCTFAGNLSDEEGLYITSQEMKQLKNTSFWETGSNGYRISYINVFDRFENYFGNLNTAEFLAVHTYLRRDYNHYLMDFIRDENRLRTESVTQMQERIAWDYKKMEELYRDDLGYVPALYILMHSNTGAFGNDPLVSRKNAEMMESVFAMNFNRQGTCLNTRDSSVYDLSRLQSRQYFSSNHLMMRIWDDTGHQVVFRLGSAEKAADWERISGAAEFKNRRIVLTTMPYGESEVRFARSLPKDLDISLRLKGNVVGQQAVKLRTDEHGDGGICVRLYDNVLLIEDGDVQAPLFTLDLLRFDGGPFFSVQQEELNGKIALAAAIIAYDEDEERIAQAERDLETLRAMRVPSIQDGAEPFIPELDIDEQDNRALRIRLEGNSISVWLDGVLVADGLSVSSGSGSSLFLEAAVTQGTERFSQTNLSDDVYDGVFAELNIRGTDGSELYSYAPPLPAAEESGPVDRAVDKVISLFHWLYAKPEE
ncbi:MAG: hypothetical protein Q4E45_02165 [Eubacteriales bacterium]|nr:hypothetical protein [Eubacteriales bacterium]